MRVLCGSFQCGVCACMYVRALVCIRTSKCVVLYAVLSMWSYMGVPVRVRMYVYVCVVCLCWVFGCVNVS